MAIPNDSFRVWDGGRKAALFVRKLPMPDTFFFANNVSVSGAVTVYMRWDATSEPVKRGKGTEVPPDDWAAFEGHFADATCHGRVKGVETGFSFTSESLTEEGFFAELGRQANGAWLTTS